MARSRRLNTYLSPAAMGVLGLAITLVVVRYPDQAFEASLDGLRLWFEIVLPALLPFFVMSEILFGLGVIRAIGVLLEPLMRPVFRIPGVGAFTLAMGLVSGYPLGAKLTGRLRRDGLCTREEAERLVSFANTADPLFMVGAVAFGMFGMASVGITIALAHYAGAFLVGFLMRYHARGKMGTEHYTGTGSLFRRAMREMAIARNQDGRPIGLLFGDAVRDSMGSMLFIGGCIMMFSVFIRLLLVSGVSGMLASALGVLVQPAGLDPAVTPALLNGLMEITLGAQTAADATADMWHRLIAAGFVIGWSGLSVHAQVAAMLHGTDIRMAPYVIARFTHGVVAALLTWVLYPALTKAASTIPAMAAMTLPKSPYWIRIAMLGGMGWLVLASLLILSLAVAWVRKIRVTGFRV